MKKYSNKKEILKNFFKLKLKNKITTILKMIGIRFLTYNFFYYLLLPLFKNKSNFFKGLLFDLQKTKHEFVGINNKTEKFILYSKDEIISKEIYVKGEFDLLKLKKTIKVLHEKGFKTERLFDVGANIGVVCIPAIKQKIVKTGFAVEPEKNNYKLLKTNIILNDLENDIQTYNFALSDSDDKHLNMELSDYNSGGHSVQNLENLKSHGNSKKNFIKVKTKKFDTLFSNVNKINDLIWIDAQGHEPFILDGCKNALDKEIPIVIEFWPYGLKKNNSWEKMINTIRGFKYFLDLSKSENNLEIINDKSLDKLTSGWDEENKDKHALFTDILLLK